MWPRTLAAALFYGHGDALLSCQVEQLKEELSQSQSEKEELRQRANELQQEASAVRDAPLCPRFRSLLLESFCPPPGWLTADGCCCLSRFPVQTAYFRLCEFRQQWATITASNAAAVTKMRFSLCWNPFWLLCHKLSSLLFPCDLVHISRSGGLHLLLCVQWLLTVIVVSAVWTRPRLLSWDSSSALLQPAFL